MNTVIDTVYTFVIGLDLHMLNFYFDHNIAYQQAI